MMMFLYIFQFCDIVEVVNQTTQDDMILMKPKAFFVMYILRNDSVFGDMIATAQ